MSAAVVASAAELDAAGGGVSKHDAPRARGGHRPFSTLIATGHTATDQVETILYRLASSPGRRALLGMAASEGRLVRPLLGLTRQDTAAYCQELKLAWHEDSSNDSQLYARARVRHGLVKALDAVHPAAQANVLRTAALLREETELLDALVDAELGAGASIAIERLRALAPALQRLVVIRLAEQASGEFAPQAGERVGEILALGDRGGRAELHVGGLAGAVIEDGELRMVAIHPREQRPPRALSGIPQQGQADDAHEPQQGQTDAREALPEPIPVDAEDPGPMSGVGPAANTLPRVVPIPERVASAAFEETSEVGEVLVGEEDLSRRVRELGEAISRDYAGRPLLLVGVLKGAVFFLSDLMRFIDIPVEVDFMAVASYGSATDSSGVVRILKDLDIAIEGRDVLIVEDIVDSGLTLQYLLRNLGSRNPASLEVCALLTKPDRRKVDLPTRYVGFEIPDRFVIGYGLDYAERHRNLPFVAVLER